MKILKNKTYQELVERISSLECWKNSKEQKEQKGIAKLPNLPKMLTCSVCYKQSLNKRKFTKFKEWNDYHNKFQKRLVCDICLKELKKPYFLNY